MNTIRCPNCENELTEAQVHIKPTKDQRHIKLRCGLCRHSWKVVNLEFKEKAQSPAVPGI